MEEFWCINAVTALLDGTEGDGDETVELTDLDPKLVAAGWPAEALAAPL